MQGQSKKCNCVDNLFFHASSIFRFPEVVRLVSAGMSSGIISLVFAMGPRRALTKVTESDCASLRRNALTAGAA